MGPNLMTAHPRQSVSFQQFPVSALSRKDQETINIEPPSCPKTVPFAERRAQQQRVTHHDLELRGATGSRLALHLMA